MSKARMAWLAVADSSNPHRMLSKVAVTNTPANGTSGATAAVATAGNDETYDFSSNDGDLIIWISNNGDEDAGDRTYIPLRFDNVASGAADASAVTVAELVAAIAAHPLASKWVTGDDNSGLRLTTKQKGAHIRMYVTGGANTILGFTQIANASSAVGAGVPTSVSLLITDLNGNYIPYATVSAAVYAAGTGDTKDATATIQNEFSSKGDITATYGTNTVSAVTDKFGVLELDVIDSGADAQTAFLDVTVSESDKTLGRTELTTGTSS